MSSDHVITAESLREAIASLTNICERCESPLPPKRIEAICNQKRHLLRALRAVLADNQAEARDEVIEALRGDQF